MNVLKILGKVLPVAASVGVGIYAGPAAGVAVAGALGVGKAAKVAGKALEAKTGVRGHKVAAPVAAVAAPAAVIPLVAPDLATQLCEIVQRLCESPAATSSVVGLAAWVIHNLSSGLAKSKVVK